ncbi:MAG: HisA/HisF-related TIM barrel protein [Gemmatimonadales bacterium]
MLTRRVIPCLDTRDGRVVKGVKFTGLRDAGRPVDLAVRYEAEGADEIVILDVSATTEGRGHALATVRAVREALGIPLTVGGGVRTVDDAVALLDAGADKVGVNTAAFRDPVLLTVLANRFGCQCIVLSVDAAARGTSWNVVVRAGTEGTSRDAVAWAAEGARRGAGEILLTSVDRDGTQAGYDLRLVTAVSSCVRVPVVASGGARSGADLVDAVRAGADAVLAASIFHDGVTTVGEVKRQMAQAGLEVRP